MTPLTVLPNAGTLTLNVSVPFPLFLITSKNGTEPPGATVGWVLISAPVLGGGVLLSGAVAEPSLDAMALYVGLTANGVGPAATGGTTPLGVVWPSQGLLGVLPGNVGSQDVE